MKADSSADGGPTMRVMQGLLLGVVLAMVNTGCAQNPPSDGFRQLHVVAVGRLTKLLVFVVENHSMNQMSLAMPYTFGMAKRYGYASNYRAITHPSLPNYIAIASGQRHHIDDDALPAEHPLTGSSVFGRAIKAGKTAKVYAESMPTNCATTDTASGYMARHNPWVYFVSERTLCRRYDVPLTELHRDVTRGLLPNIGMVVPNRCNDAHDCALPVADAWLKDQLGDVLDGPDWRSGGLAVVITADEDDYSQGNKVLTVVLHPSQRRHVVASPLTHYSLARLYEDVAGVPHVANAVMASSMTAAFGLRVHRPVE